MRLAGFSPVACVPWRLAGYSPARPEQMSPGPGV
jgi:hypothetical protein